MDLFALVYAQNKVNTVKKQSEMRFDEYLQNKAQKQQAASNQQTASIFDKQLNTNKEEKQGFEAIA